MKMIGRIRARGAKWLAFATIAVGGIASGDLWAAQQDLCVPTIGGLAGNPTIDGVVGSFNQGINDDLGWNSAVKVNLSDDNGATRTATMQMGRTSTDLYVAFSIGAPTPGYDNTIVLTLSTDGNHAHDWRIQITPFDNGTVTANGTNLQPFQVAIWRDSTLWNNSATAIASPILDDYSVNGQVFHRIRYSRSGGTGNNAGYWELELQIPIETNVANAGSNAKVYIPSSGVFSYYANVISTSVLLGSYFQDSWPQSVAIVPLGVDYLLNDNTPASASWGNVSFNSRPQCGGVSLSSSNIGVVDPNSPGSIINSMRAYNGVTETTVAQCQALADNYNWPGTSGPQNTFIARPLNGMPGNANAISAKFYLANWGIPGVPEWSPIGDLYKPSVAPSPVGNNPTAASGIVAPGATVDLTSTWSLSYKQSCAYLLSNGGHHCIQVEMDSTDPNTFFSNKSVQQNMNFYPASTYTSNALISVRGQGKPPAGRAEHEMFLLIDSAEQSYTRDGGYFYATHNYNPDVKTHETTTGGGGAMGLRYPEFSKIPAAAFPKGMNKALIWIARGYLKMGNKLVINGRTYEYAKGVGAFGYLAGHAGDVQVWRPWLQGTGLVSMGNGAYSVHIPTDGSVSVTTTVHAVEPGQPDPGPTPPPPKPSSWWEKFLHWLWLIFCSWW